MTTVSKNILIKASPREFVAQMLSEISDSIGDMIVTVAVVGISVMYIMQLLPKQIAGQFVGLYILGFMVQLFIRIVHRFDEQYTTNELAERVIEFEESSKEQMTRIEQMVLDINISQVREEEK